MEREEKREQFRQAALAIWTHFQTTGLHVTAQEAESWLAKLEAGIRLDRLRFESRGLLVITCGKQSARLNQAAELLSKRLSQFRSIFFRALHFDLQSLQF